MLEYIIEIKSSNQLWQRHFALYGRRTDQAHHRAGIEGALPHYVQVLWQGKGNILELHPRRQIRVVDDMAQVVLTRS